MRAIYDDAQDIRVVSQVNADRGQNLDPRVDFASFLQKFVVNEIEASLGAVESDVASLKKRL